MAIPARTGGPDWRWRAGDRAQVRRLHASIAAALREGRSLSDPVVVAASRKLDVLTLRAMHRRLGHTGSSRHAGAPGRMASA